METNGLRMYFLVMYNLSPIQQGIQAGHAALEYAMEYGDDPKFQDFAKNHKTFIVLNGGTSSDMEKWCDELSEHDIVYAEFIEPDLNDSISAIAFLVEERIYGISDIDLYKFFISRSEEEKWLYYFISQFKLA